MRTDGDSSVAFLHVDEEWIRMVFTIGLCCRAVFEKQRNGLVCSFLRVFEAALPEANFLLRIERDELV